jgi:hypothetical protein
MKWFHTLLLLICVVLSFSFDLPRGWYAAGSKPGSYEMGIDKTVGRDGRSCATIQSIDKKIIGYGTLMQTCAPAKYQGKRVRMRGYIKTQDITGWVGMWFRVDKNGKSIAYDNMEFRPIKGTTEWRPYDIVLNIDESASMLAYGVLITGTGKVWFDDITFEIVDNQTITTDKYFSEPTNLNFEEY